MMAGNILQVLRAGQRSSATRGGWRDVSGADSCDVIKRFFLGLTGRGESVGALRCMGGEDGPAGEWETIARGLAVCLRAMLG